MSDDKVLVPREFLEKLSAYMQDDSEWDAVHQLQVLLAQPSDGALTNEEAEPVALPESVDSINAENAPRFMGEPNPHHPIEWYREGIAKHWKTICDQRLRLEQITAALKFYADREHFHFESGNWDTVSGEPLNILWCGDEPDFVEDGTVARACLDRVKELNS